MCFKLFYEKKKQSRLKVLLIRHFFIVGLKNDEIHKNKLVLRI